MTKHRRACVACVAALALAAPLVARAGCEIKTLELPVRMAQSRAVATVVINGTSVPMTVDSSSTLSRLTDAAAAQLGLTVVRDPEVRVRGIVGKLDTKTTTVDRLKLFNGEIERVQFVVGGNEPGGGTMGLIGRDILSVGDTEYDLAHGMIRLVFPGGDCEQRDMAYWAGTSPVADVDLIVDYRVKLPSIRAHARLDGRDLVALFDTGALFTIVSSRAESRAAVAEADLMPAGTVFGAGRGSAKLWTAPFDKFELGGEAIRLNRLHVAEVDLVDADMALGVDFFLSHHVYVSKQQAKMFFTYNGGPVFTFDKREAASKAAAGSDIPGATADEFARRGAASAARQDYASALADLDRACALEPTSAALFAQRGAIQVALKRPAQASEDFDRALQLDPGQDDARLRRAVLRLDAKDRDGAQADLDALDRTLAPQAQMRLGVAQLYLRLEQPAKALVPLDQWLAAHPHEVTRAVAQNERCRARLLLGFDLEKALDDCDDAVDGDPKNPTYLSNRGWVLVRLGRYRKALSDFDRSIEYRPHNAVSLYGRGLAKGRLGEAAQGDADFAAARKLQADIDRRVERVGLTKEPSPKP